eukprot:TRINITY_DN67003_c3_g1_i1.p1 TRINITY_DN67003_c3_g1~~TRINITY_DN67003_c3_g1_i1.p1  ORF type:complete len:423 (-),score=25.59 TRINITY_DN67003_c3_g1_i1:213-1481(-)
MTSAAEENITSGKAPIKGDNTQILQEILLKLTETQSDVHQLKQGVAGLEQNMERLQRTIAVKLEADAGKNLWANRVFLLKLRDDLSRNWSSTDSSTLFSRLLAWCKEGGDKQWLQSALIGRGDPTLSHLREMLSVLHQCPVESSPLLFRGLRVTDMDSFLQKYSPRAIIVETAFMACSREFSRARDFTEGSTHSVLTILLAEMAHPLERIWDYDTTKHYKEKEFIIAPGSMWAVISSSRCTNQPFQMLLVLCQIPCPEISLDIMHMTVEHDTDLLQQREWSQQVAQHPEFGDITSTTMTEGTINDLVAGICKGGGDDVTNPLHHWSDAPTFSSAAVWEAAANYMQTNSHITLTRAMQPEPEKQTRTKMGVVKHFIRGIFGKNTSHSSTMPHPPPTSSSAPTPPPPSSKNIQQQQKNPAGATA